MGFIQILPSRPIDILIIAIYFFPNPLIQGLSNTSINRLKLIFGKEIFIRFFSGIRLLQPVPENLL